MDLRYVMKKKREEGMPWKKLKNTRFNMNKTVKILSAQNI